MMNHTQRKRLVPKNKHQKRLTARMYTERVDTRSMTHNDAPRDRTAHGDEKRTATGHDVCADIGNDLRDNSTKTCTLDECTRVNRQDLLIVFENATCFIQRAKRHPPEVGGGALTAWA
jgi:hypothetical protein